MADDADIARLDSLRMQQQKQKENELLAAAFPSSSSVPAAAPNPIGTLLQGLLPQAAASSAVPVAAEPRAALPVNWQQMVQPAPQPVGNLVVRSPQGEERTVRRFR